MFRNAPPSPDDDRRETFLTEYRMAWEAAGNPRIVDIEEVFASAMCGEEAPSAALHPLWVFFVATLQKNIPLNWFMDAVPFLTY